MDGDHQLYIEPTMHAMQKHINIIIKLCDNFASGFRYVDAFCDLDLCITL